MSALKWFDMGVCPLVDRFSPQDRARGPRIAPVVSRAGTLVWRCRYRAMVANAGSPMSVKPCLSAASAAGDNRPVSTIRPMPPLNADERNTLESWLDFHRATLAMKFEGLAGFP